MNETSHPHAVLWDRVIRERSADFHGIHGPRHWVRVERNGLYLARETGADVEVVTMFALFHDSCRINDSIDDGHGERGAAYALAMRPHLDFLDNTAFDKLVFACTWHTDLVHHEDPTIHTCFDADRLDLGRVGIVPDPKYLNTAQARRLAGCNAVQVLDEEPSRLHQIRPPDNFIPGGQTPR